MEYTEEIVDDSDEVAKEKTDEEEEDTGQSDENSSDHPIHGAALHDMQLAWLLSAGRGLEYFRMLEFSIKNLLTSYPLPMSTEWIPSLEFDGAEKETMPVLES